MEDEDEEGFGFGELSFDLDKEYIANEALMLGKE